MAFPDSWIVSSSPILRRSRPVRSCTSRYFWESSSLSSSSSRTVSWKSARGTKNREKMPSGRDTVCQRRRYSQQPPPSKAHCVSVTEAGLIPQTWVIAL